MHIPCLSTMTLLLLLAGSFSLSAQGGDQDITASSATPVHKKANSAYTDFLYTQDRKIYQDIYTEMDREQKADIHLACYRYEPGKDSILIYRNLSTQKLKPGPQKVAIGFQESTDKYYILPVFANLLRKTDIIPPGTYKIFLSIYKGPDTLIGNKVFIRDIDSTLSIQSSTRKGINDVLQPRANTMFPGMKPLVAVKDKASTMMERSKYKLDRYFKKKGLVPLRYQQNGQEIIDLYAEDWFMGRYTLQSDASLGQQLKGQQENLEQDIGSFASNNLGDYQSLLSQFRELKKNSRENKDLTGEIALSANFSNDQEQFSQQANNYYEARGSLEFPLFDIPISLSGYYTTQDKDRKAKAGYVHLRYDAEKAKEQLMKLIGSYNKRYEQTLMQGGSYDMIYGQFIGQLQSQKDKAITGLQRQVALPDMDFSTLSEEQLKAAVINKANEQKDKLKDSLMDGARNTGTAAELDKKARQVQEATQKAGEAYTKALEQYNRIKELERKIEKYRVLLEQYKQTAYYDSLMAYSKVKDLQDMDGASYKDMAKKASGLLPESKAKGLITGLTNLDAGMFPKYVSDYTLSGQMLKGLDIGYDIGFAEVGGSYGKTEYIDRDGNVEGYKAYSGRVRFKPVLEQEIGLVYYGYSPGRQLLGGSDFFKDVSISMPSFRNPVHIVSATYKGNISQYLDLSGEYALSGKQGQSEAASKQASLKDKSAYNIKLEGTIPATAIHIEAGYEQAGKAFENNTLPILMSGTERYRVGGKGELFRSFLSLGLEYNYLVQHSFSSKADNTKWGFNIATHSKRYPSVSLSYKPFSTFRSFNDTLNIEQKPILGEVWTGKINYQIKKKDRAIRFSLMYNRNTSTMDTLQYGSTLVQFNTIYSYKTTMFSLNLGSSDIRTDDIETVYPVFNHSRFANISASGNVLKPLMLTGGTDVATTSAGISRYGFFIGSVYSFKRLPVLLRANFRYSNYRLDGFTGWKQLYAGGIELAWRFKVKLFDN